MRDTMMNEQYFLDFIAEETARIQRFCAKLEAGEVRDDRVFSVEQRVWSLKLSVFIARYSLGEECGGLKRDFDEIFKDVPRFWTRTSSYVNMVWIMAIAVMLDADPDYFSELSRLLDKYDRHDALLDFFCDYKLHGETALRNRAFQCPVPYAELGRVIESEHDRPKLLKAYVEKKWYPGHKKFGICGVHKLKEKIYSGYWSFESGAVAKILNIDDSELKESPYYPYDLAHFCW